MREYAFLENYSEQYDFFDEAYGTKEENKNELVSISKELVSILSTKSGVKDLKYRKSLFKKDAKFISGKTNKFSIVFSSKKDNGLNSLSIILASLSAAIIGFGFYTISSGEVDKVAKYIVKHKGSLEEQLSKKFKKDIKISNLHKTTITEQWEVTITVK